MTARMTRQKKAAASGPRPITIGSLKNLAELLSQAIILYAAYSDFFIRALALAPIPAADTIAKILVSAAGIFVLLYIFFARTGNANAATRTYAHPFPARVLALLFSVMLAISIIINIWSLLNQHATLLKTYESQFDIPSETWVRDNLPSGTGEWVYKTSFRAPTNSKCRHLSLVISCYEKFRLNDVQVLTEPGATTTIDNEPMEIGRFRDTRSEWLLPCSDKELNWTLYVVIAHEPMELTPPPAPPFTATSYLHDD